MPPFPVSELLVMSWSAGNPRDSSLFTSWGVLYRFETGVERKKTVTTIWRAISETKQERVARFEWNADGDLGRALIGKRYLSLVFWLAASSAPFPTQQCLPSASNLDPQRSTSLFLFQVDRQFRCLIL